MSVDGTALLMGDTSAWYHWGCSCTSLGIHAELRERWQRVHSLPMHRMAELAGLPASVEDFDSDQVFASFAAANAELVATVEQCDRVYVNGEGTLHGTGPAAVTLLYLMHIARTRLDREVHLINHSSYPDDNKESADSPAAGLYRQVLSQLDFVGVREPESFRLLADLDVEAVQSFDCLPLFLERHYRPVESNDKEAGAVPRRVIVAGSAAWGSTDAVDALGGFLGALKERDFEPVVLLGAARYLAADDVIFAERLAKAAPGSFEVNLASGELDWLRAIDEAALLVSGRFHHTIAAAFLNTPFLVMESNTPKISGLLEALGSESFLSIANAADGLLDAAMPRVERPAEFHIDRDRQVQLRQQSCLNFV